MHLCTCTEPSMKHHGALEDKPLGDSGSMWEFGVSKAIVQHCARDSLQQFPGVCPQIVWAIGVLTSSNRKRCLCALWSLGADAVAGSCFRVPLLDVYGSVRFRAWVVPLQGATPHFFLLSGVHIGVTFWMYSLKSIFPVLHYVRWIVFQVRITHGVGTHMSWKDLISEIIRKGFAFCWLCGNLFNESWHLYRSFA